MILCGIIESENDVPFGSSLVGDEEVSDGPSEGDDSDGEPIRIKEGIGKRNQREKKREEERRREKRREEEREEGR